jgi:hypothetical protein
VWHSIFHAGDRTLERRIDWTSVDEVDHDRVLRAGCLARQRIISLSLSLSLSLLFFPSIGCRYPERTREMRGKIPQNLSCAFFFPLSVVTVRARILPFKEGSVVHEFFFCFFALFVYSVFIE